MSNFDRELLELINENTIDVIIEIIKDYLSLPE